MSSVVAEPEALIGAETGSPDELTPPESAIVAAIAGGRWAWSSLIHLVATGHDPAVIEGLASRGHSSHLVYWDTPEDHTPPNPPPCGRVVTLTPYGACCAGVEIEEEGPAERPRWGKVRPEGTRNPVVVRRFEVALRLPEFIPDTGPSPVQVLLDEFTGEPVLLQGRPIVVDRRLRGKKAKA